MDKVIELIKLNYGLLPRLVKIIDGGYLGNNYFLTSGKGNFFLKGYCYQDISKVEEIQKIEFFLADGGIPVILPIKNNQGLYIFTVEGIHYSLFPYIEGRIVHRDDLTQKVFESAGKMLARIHLLSKNGIPDFVTEIISPYNKSIFSEELQLIEKKLEDKTQLDSFDQLAREAIYFKKNAVERNKIKYQDLNLPDSHLIHGDYHEANLFFDGNENVSHVFDLEKAKRAPRVYDIIRAMDSMCFFTHFENHNFENAKSFIQAYGSIYPLDQVEFETGIKYYYLKKIHSLLIEKEHYLKHNNRLNDFLKSDLVSLSYYSSNLENYTKRLMEFLRT
ncbi:MAG: phosphotransferase [Patescibacteria group bacterium]